MSDGKEKFYDDHAENWDNESMHDPMKMEYVVRVLELKGGEDILDVGTGTGVLIPYYEKSGVRHIKAIDISEKMISVASRKYPKASHPSVDFLMEDLYDLKEEGVYDRVVCYSCFPHFKDQPKALSILCSTLKEEGTLAVVHSDSREQIQHIHENRGEHVAHDSLPGLIDMKKMFNDAGMSVVFQRDDDEYYIVIGKKGPSERGLSKEEMYSLLLKEYDDIKDEGRDVYFDHIISDYRRDIGPE